jgi:hypothetical protein
MRKLFACVASLLALLFWSSSSFGYEPTKDYEVREIEGWTVRVSAKLRERRELTERVLKLLQARLIEMDRVLPAAALRELRDVVLWVELDQPAFPGMCFHPSRDWLRENGYNPDKAGGIEIGNARHFLAWADEQPSMVLHEFAHAYHHTVLGVGNPEVSEAFKAAGDGGKYNAVLRASGKTERSYALNNAEEFFAELSEAYFGTNDFYPFVRAELRQYDRKSFDMIERMWTKPPTTTRSSAPTTRPSVPATQPTTRGAAAPRG